MTARTRLWLRVGLFWAAMMALLALALLAARLGWWALPAMMAAGMGMTALVAARAMELPRSGAVSLISALAGILFLATMFALTLADEFTRPHIPAGFQDIESR